VLTKIATLCKFNDVPLNVVHFRINTEMKEKTVYFGFLAVKTMWKSLWKLWITLCKLNLLKILWKLEK